MAEKHSPLEQFAIKPILELKVGGYDISFTNSALMMFIALGLVTLVMVYGMRHKALVPGRMQSMAEISYELIANLLRDNVGKAGMPYFPFVFSVFMFILAANLLGMLPYSFTFTSHIIVTFAMAATIFVGVTIIGFAKHGLHFFSLFLPAGTPMFLAPLIILIEIISYFVRPVSLSVRLFGNMVAGHTMLKVFAGFVIALGIFGVAPLILIVALTGLEIGIAIIQAYVFTILTCIYLNDAVNLHH